MINKELFTQARKAHREEEWDRAEELYLDILEREPSDPDVNHLLGVLKHQKGEHSAALLLIERALKEKSNYPASHNNHGRVLQELGRYDEALQSFEKAVELQPDFAEAHNNLGTVYRKLGQLDKAEVAYRKSVTIRPDYVKALNNIGNLCQVRREYHKALDWYGQALSFDPDSPVSQYNLGCVLIQLGRLDEAEAALLHALKMDPEMVEAMNLVGMLYASRYQFKKAVEILKQSIRHSDDTVLGRINLANVYAAMNRFEKAVKYIEDAAEIAPDSLEVLNNLSLIYKSMGRTAKAYNCLKRAAEIQPDNLSVLTNLANMYMIQGEFSRSAETCRQAIQQNGEFAPAYYQLAQVVSGEDTIDLSRDIMELLKAEKNTLEERIQLTFGLAKLLEDQQRYAQSFMYLEEGNRLKRSTYTFSLEFYQKVIDRICEVYSLETFQRFAGKGCESTVPIFIVGLPRSGTTLVEQILASHPDVFGAGELSLFVETVEQYVEVEVLNGQEVIPPDLSLSRKDFSILGEMYVNKLQQYAPGSRHIIDKMPGNFLHLGLINLVLPRARIIHCTRDPVDTCLSMYKKLFTHGHQYAYNLQELGEYYLLYRRLMEHWYRVLLGKFMELSYENMVRNQADETRRLLDFCGLDWHDGCLNFYKYKRPVSTASSVQVRRPITSRSVGLWKKYEPELQPLLSVLQPYLDN